MCSFLMAKKQKKTFAEKISKFSENMKNSIYASRTSFEKFCVEYYDGRKSEEIFSELKLLKGQEQTERIEQKKS